MRSACSTKCSRNGCRASESDPVDDRDPVPVRAQLLAIDRAASNSDLAADGYTEELVLANDMSYVQIARYLP